MVVIDLLPLFQVKKKDILVLICLLYSLFGITKDYIYGSLSGYYHYKPGVVAELQYTKWLSPKLRFETGPGFLYDGQDSFLRWKLGITLASRIREGHACTHRYTEKLPINLVSMNYNTNTAFNETYLLLLYNHYFRIGYGLYLTPGIGYTFLDSNQPYGEIGFKLLLRN